MTWYSKDFDQLTAHEFYLLIKLRIEVFVVEQNCPYQEVEEKDPKSIHLFCISSEGEAIAVARIIKPAKDAQLISFGRVAVKKELRGTEVSNDLMTRILRYIFENYPRKSIEISAQCYITSYYERFGFEQQGEVYLEDEIPHIKMVKKLAIDSKPGTK